MKNDYYKSPTPSWLTRQFWRAAGADRYLLERSTYSDQIKYFCLGGIVVATGVMAALAGGYAFYTIFEPKGQTNASTLTDEMVAAGLSASDLIHWPTLFLSMIFGMIWGLIIYNIDRFIVTSTGKGDGTEAITKQEIMGAIPRIIMGLIIALTISKPLEIRMFKSEIDQALFEEQEKIKRDEKKKINQNYQVEINEIDNNILKLEKEVQDAKITYQEYDNAAVEEWEGKSGTGQSGDGPAYRMKRATADNYKEIWETTTDNNKIKIDALEKQREEIKATMDGELATVNEKANKLDGLLERLKLAHQVSGFWISLFITLLFVVIELTPIFFKMMLIKGPYDYMDENVKELSRAELGIEVEYNFYTDKEGLDKHKVTNHAAENKRREKLALLKAQDEMNQKIIEEWKKRELKRIEANPDDYISNA